MEDEWGWFSVRLGEKLNRSVVLNECARMKC